MKRIATYYENRLGRNDGAPLYYTHVLKTTPGIELVHLSSEDTGDLGRFGKFDLHLWVDWGEDALKGVLPYEPMRKIPSPSVYVCSDTHLGKEYRFDKAKNFDWIFFNQKRAVSEFLKDNPSFAGRVFWLPHAVEPRAYPNSPLAVKKWDVGFVGFVTFEKRAKMLDRMFREFPDFFYGQRFFEQAAEVYRKSKIVFNTAAVDDINMRIFEALAAGSFLLTEYVPTLGEMFNNRKHLVWFKDMEEAVKLAKYYLKHDEEREAIAKAGMESVLARHTYRHRFETIAKTINFTYNEKNKDESHQKAGGRSIVRSGRLAQQNKRTG